MMLGTNKVKYKEIKSTNNLKNGGYVMYWKLYKQLVDMLSDKNAAIKTIKDNLIKINAKKRNNIFDLKFERTLNQKVNWLFFRAKCYTYTIGFVWFCLLKPLGQFISRTIYISGSYKMINDTVFENVDLTKSTTYKLFNIPVWKNFNQKFTEEELTNLKK